MSSTSPKKKPNVLSYSSTATPLANFKAQVMTRQTMQNRGDQIEFIHHQLDQEIEALNEEIRLDQKASDEYQKQFDKFNKRKAELHRIIKEQESFTIQFDEQIGPFEARYSELQHSVDHLHKNAQKKYEAAVQLLIDKLNYHPAYKRHNDTI